MKMAFARKAFGALGRAMSLSNKERDAAVEYRGSQFCNPKGLYEADKPENHEDRIKGSRFCNPRGLEGGAAPDTEGRGAGAVPAWVRDGAAQELTDVPGDMLGEKEQIDAGEVRRGEQGKVPTKASAKRVSRAWAIVDDGQQKQKDIEAPARSKSKRGDKPAKAPRLCAVLDTNAAILYGEYMTNGCEERLHPSFRGLLCDDSVDKVVTPAVMNEVWGLLRNKRIGKKTAQNIKSLAVKIDNAASSSGRIAGAIEAEQRRLMYETDSETAVRWLAAKRKHHEKATGKDYGPVDKMRPINRYNNMSKLCDLAATDRAVMGEAGAVSMRRARTVLISGDADVSLFAAALKSAAGGRIDVVGIEPEPRRGRVGRRA